MADNRQVAQHPGSMRLENEMKLKEIHAMIDTNNDASRNVLKKLGFKFLENFDYEGDPSDWFKITNKNN